MVASGLGERKGDCKNAVQGIQHFRVLGDKLKSSVTQHSEDSE